jgi:hypothetical protein
LTEFDNLSWTPEIQVRFPEKQDPDLAFVKPRFGAREPYIDLYMYLIMQTIARWPSVKAILPSAAELNKGRDRAATQCKLLLGCQYVAAFSPEDGIFTMTLLDPKLYHDEDWIAAQVELNPCWDRKKEVFLWTPEMVANVDATLAGTVTKHVGVKQGG